MSLIINNLEASKLFRSMISLFLLDFIYKILKNETESFTYNSHARKRISIRKKIS